MDIVDCHPVLLPFKECNYNVFFNGKAESPAELSGLLLEAHLAIAANWIPVSRFINGELNTITRESYGLLASAPESFAQAYLDVLTKLHMKPSMVDRSPPKRWQDGKWIDETACLRALLLGDSYFVFEHIQAARC